MGSVTVARNVGRRSSLLLLHARASGSPPVGGEANPDEAEQHENDDWSRARVRVYASRKAAPHAVAPVNDSVSCLVSDWRSESISRTRPNSGWAREPAGLTAAVPGTMESAGTYTGRPASSSSVKRGVATRFRSRKPYWLTPRA